MLTYEELKEAIRTYTRDSQAVGQHKRGYHLAEHIKAGSSFFINFPPNQLRGYSLEELSTGKLSFNYYSHEITIKASNSNYFNFKTYRKVISYKDNITGLTFKPESALSIEEKAFFLFDTSTLEGKIDSPLYNDKFFSFIKGELSRSLRVAKKSIEIIALKIPLAFNKQLKEIKEHLKEHPEDSAKEWRIANIKIDPFKTKPWNLKTYRGYYQREYIREFNNLLEEATTEEELSALYSLYFSGLFFRIISYYFNSKIADLKDSDSKEANTSAQIQRADLSFSMENPEPTLSELLEYFYSIEQETAKRYEGISQQAREKIEALKEHFLPNELKEFLQLEAKLKHTSEIEDLYSYSETIKKEGGELTPAETSKEPSYFYINNLTEREKELIINAMIYKEGVSDKPFSQALAFYIEYILDYRNYIRDAYNGADNYNALLIASNRGDLEPLKALISKLFRNILTLKKEEFLPASTGKELSFSSDPLINYLLEEHPLARPLDSRSKKVEAYREQKKALEIRKQELEEELKKLRRSPKPQRIATTQQEAFRLSAEEETEGRTAEDIKRDIKEIEARLIKNSLGITEYKGSYYETIGYYTDKNGRLVKEGEFLTTLRSKELGLEADKPAIFSLLFLIILKAQKVGEDRLLYFTESDILAFYDANLKRRSSKGISKDKIYTARQNFLRYLHLLENLELKFSDLPLEENKEKYRSSIYEAIIELVGERPNETFRIITDSTTDKEAKYSSVIKASLGLFFYSIVKNARGKIWTNDNITKVGALTSWIAYLVNKRFFAYFKNTRLTLGELSKFTPINFEDRKHTGEILAPINRALEEGNEASLIRALGLFNTLDAGESVLIEPPDTEKTRARKREREEFLAGQREQREAEARKQGANSIKKPKKKSKKKKED